jgi:hypothetical protein
MICEGRRRSFRRSSNIAERHAMAFAPDAKQTTNRHQLRKSATKFAALTAERASHDRNLSGN